MPVVRRAPGGSRSCCQAGGRLESGVEQLTPETLLTSQPLDLPDRLQTTGGVHAHGLFDEVRIFEEGDFALPDVQVYKVGTAGLRKRRERTDVGIVGLLLVRNVRRTAQFIEGGIPELAGDRDPCQRAESTAADWARAGRDFRRAGRPHTFVRGRS